MLVLELGLVFIQRIQHRASFFVRSSFMTTATRCSPPGPPPPFVVRRHRHLRRMRDCGGRLCNIRREVRKLVISLMDANRPPSLFPVLWWFLSSPSFVWCHRSHVASRLVSSYPPTHLIVAVPCTLRRCRLLCRHRRPSPIAPRLVVVFVVRLSHLVASRHVPSRVSFLASLASCLIVAPRRRHPAPTPDRAALFFFETTARG